MNESSETQYLSKRSKTQTCGLYQKNPCTWKKIVLIDFDYNPINAKIEDRKRQTHKESATHIEELLQSKIIKYIVN